MSNDYFHPLSFPFPNPEYHWVTSKGLAYEFSQTPLQIDITVNCFSCHTEPNFQGYLIYNLLFPLPSCQTFAFRSLADFSKGSASDPTWSECVSKLKPSSGAIIIDRHENLWLNQMSVFPLTCLWNLLHEVILSIISLLEHPSLFYANTDAEHEIWFVIKHLYAMWNLR